MREVTNLADTLRGTIAQLKNAANNATTRFQKEFQNSQANLAKVDAFTNELAAANKDVEAMLAETNSNFPNAAANVSSVTPVSKPDTNGVMVNKG